MKLSNWAKKQGISYITAWRWFNEGKLPVKAYRSDSGTIIVQDETETLEQVMVNPQSNDVMSMVLKKTVEFSKNSGSVEDFAAWVLSTFALKLNGTSESPKYSRSKPKPEEVQKHFQQFLKPKGEKPKPNMFVAPEEVLEEIAKTDGLTPEEANTKITAAVQKTFDNSNIPTMVASDIPELNDSLLELFTPSTSVNNVALYSNSAGGVVTRSVDLTPQLNYTGSTNAAFGSNHLTSPSSSCHYDASHTSIASINDGSAHPLQSFVANTFGPTQKELLSSSKIMEVVDRPRRGRKPSKNFRKPE
jgi:hypothetical protein